VTRSPAPHRLHRGLVRLAWLCIAAPAASCACALRSVAIEPAAAEPTDTYVGRTQTLELRFHNDKTSGPVDVFPEPPLTVKQLKAASECTIRDGGIWVRQHVYASGDGQTLATHEYSGSNDELVFYDARTCGRKASLDVSHTQWAIEGDTIVMTPAKAGSRAVKIRLDAACLPAVRR
jgi:hypothetical protein